MNLKAKIPEAVVELSAAAVNLKDYNEFPQVVEEILGKYLCVDWVGFYTASVYGTATSVTTNPHLPFDWNEKYMEIAHLDPFRKRGMLTRTGDVIISSEDRNPDDEIETYCYDFARRYADTAHVMSLTAIRNNQMVAAINLNRHEMRKTFTGEEKYFYQAVAPVLGLASKHILICQQHAMRRVAYEKLIGENRFAVIMNEHLIVLDFLPETRRLLRDYFGPMACNPLPDPLMRWIETDIAPSWKPGQLAGPWNQRFPGIKGTLACTAFAVKGPSDRPMVLISFQPHGETEDFSLLERAGLTHREGQVLNYLPLGYTNRQIAMAMGIGENGVKQHLKRLSRKLNAAGRAELLYRALTLKQKLQIIAG